MTEDLGGSALEDLRAECETLRHQLLEAHRALASASGRSDVVLGGVPENVCVHPPPSTEGSTHRRLAEDILQGVALLSSSGEVLHANQRLAQLMGIAPEQLCGSSLTDHFPNQLAAEIPTWLDAAAAQPVRTSHRIPTRDGQVKHLHFSINKMPPDANASRSLVVTDLDQLFDPQAERTKGQASTATDESIEHVRAHALTLLRSALDAHARAEAIHDELQREISERKRAQVALAEAQRRHELLMETIGSTHWLSTADWQTLLFLEKNQPTSRRIERPAASFDFTLFGLAPEPST
ncbi:PAS domain S-box protein [Thiorhodococcus mannitoliphagus]|uniref:PAS domain S-box protein n=1 Tax=Thiorhodococcus mannitoliphagus TaxID=329406 RepID=A0A6P1DYU9_9GAMM|nr:PAS domain-containing protein [Thiorhodococcus mannitoliphagus]NEX21896.1 PAS domain S-box protein [Thiorhodococcus mannitoliphagus]